MNPIQLTRGDALLVIDMQVDFLPGGKLGVPQGDEVIAPVNRLLGLSGSLSLPIYASRDWHPGDHCSFAARGGPGRRIAWPGPRGRNFPKRSSCPSAP